MRANNYHASRVDHGLKQLAQRFAAGDAERLAKRDDVPWSTLGARRCQSVDGIISNDAMPNGHLGRSRKRGDPPLNGGKCEPEFPLQIFRGNCALPPSGQRDLARKRKTRQFEDMSILDEKRFNAGLKRLRNPQRGFDRHRVGICGAQLQDDTSTRLCSLRNMRNHHADFPLP